MSPSRFVFIDNTYPWALFELNLNPDGTQQGPIVPRPIVGLGPSGLSDAEGIARIDVEGAIDLILASSLGFRGVDTSGKAVAHNGLVRIRYGADGDLHAEVVRGFRDWLITGHPELAAAARLLPDKDGLNIEGLAWDPSRRALLFGLRSPVNVGRIPVPSVLLDTGAPWTTAALQIGPELAIDKSGFPAPQGIRDIDYHPARQEFLVLVSRSIRGGDAPFELCTWYGAASGVNILDVTFEPVSSMKPEGVNAFPRDGPRKIFIVDDPGGDALARTRRGLTPSDLLTEHEPLTTPRLGGAVRESLASAATDHYARSTHTHDRAASLYDRLAAEDRGLLVFRFPARGGSACWRCCGETARWPPLLGGSGTPVDPVTDGPRHREATLGGGISRTYGLLAAASWPSVRPRSERTGFE